MFGCKCYPCLREYRPHKLDKKSKPCIFLAYPQNQEGIYLSDPRNMKFYFLRNVKFCEEDFTLSTILYDDNNSSIGQHSRINKNPNPSLQEIAIIPSANVESPTTIEDRHFDTLLNRDTLITHSDAIGSSRLGGLDPTLMTNNLMPNLQQLTQ